MDQKIDNKNYKNPGEEYPSISFSLVLTTLLGLPTRLHGKTKLTFREIIRNLFGGWDSLNNGRTNDWSWWQDHKNYSFEGKRRWNLLFLTVLPIKWVIFAFKLVSLPFKFVLNVVKFFTEFLAEVLLNYSGNFLGQLSSFLPRLYYDDEMSKPDKFIWGILASLALIVVAPVHMVARLLALVSTAMFSPEKSARMAWNYGRALNSRWGYLFAFLGATLSLSLTAILWTLTLPLVLTEAVTLIPALGSLLSSLAQLPLIANALSTINGVAVLVSGTLPAAFSFVSTAFASVFGVAVSASTIAIAATVAFIVAPLASIISRVADVLSKRWAMWPAETPLLEACEVTFMDAQNGVVELLPSFMVEEAVSAKSYLSKVAEYSHLSAEKHAEDKPYQAQIERSPSTGIPLDEPKSSLGQH